MTKYYVYEDSNEFLSLWKIDSNGTCHRYYSGIEEWHPCFSYLFTHTHADFRMEISEKDAFYFIITGGVSTNIELLFNNEKRKHSPKNSE